MSALDRLKLASKDGHLERGFVVVQISLTDLHKLLAVVEAASRDADPSFELARSLDRLEEDK